MRSESYLNMEKQLVEINKTLIPHNNSCNGKIGIFLPGQNGDVMSAMSVLKYKDILWPNKEIIWFCNMPCADAFKFNMVSEVRVYPWESMDVDPNTQLKDNNNRLRHERKIEFSEIRDLEDAYFPAPWMYSVIARHGIDYPNISKRCFGVNKTWEWHPYLFFSEEERDMVKIFCNSLPYSKTIMLETFGGSGQTTWDDSMTRTTMRVCREKLGDCNFIFASVQYLKDDYVFPPDIMSQKGVVFIAGMTVRQTALVNDYCDLIVCVSSGISVATSCWGAKPVPKLQFCNSFICSTVSLANGFIELVTPNSRNVFEEKLINILNKIK